MTNLHYDPQLEEEKENVKEKEDETEKDVAGCHNLPQIVFIVRT